MRKNYRIVIALGLLLAFLFSLTACGSDPQETVTEAAVPLAIAEPTADTNQNSPNAPETAVAPATDAAPATTTPPPTVYPGPAQPAASPTHNIYPGPQPSPTSAPSDPYPFEGETAVYMPITGGAPPPPTPTATPLPPGPTPVPTVDFAAQRTALQANAQDLGFVKLGFHVTLLEDRDILDGWMTALDAAGVPFFLKAVDNAEPLFRAQELMGGSGVPHVLVYRASGGVPNYELPPEQAAQIHWEFHRGQFPPELDPSLVWVETLNEPDRKQPEWLGRFALETARLAMADGFRWAAFGWASGEPEPSQWQAPSMLEFLRLAGANPDQLAIAVHEYSYTIQDIGHDYPFKIGRFLELFRIADANGFPRPTVLVTEWGWEYADIPDVEQAMRDVRWASRLYAPYPEVKGAAIWNLGLGCCYDDISDQVSGLIGPLTDFALTKYYSIPQPPAQQAIAPEQFRP